MNGELVKWNEAKVPFLTHALHYGSLRGDQVFQDPERSRHLQAERACCKDVRKCEDLLDEDALLSPGS